MFLGLGAADKTYIDDVFSTYLYAETGSTVTVNNSVDMSEGGMVWFKNREAADSHVLVDSVRGGTKVIHSDTTAVESTQSGAITSFNTNGFEIGNYGAINGGSNKDVASWTFRKAPGFFDVVKYSGTGSATTISHSLGCVPGLIIIKAIDGTIGWRVYHRATGASKTLELQGNFAAYTSDVWNDTAPTATEFSLKTDDAVNNSTLEYVAYVFAGGESTADTARSVDYDGSDDNTVWQNLSGDNADDLTFGTGDFTVEGWAKTDSMSNYPTICDFRDQTAGSSTTDGFWLGLDGGILKMWSGGAYLQSTGIQLYAGAWFHFAVVKNSGTIKIFVNGVQSGADYTTSTDFNNSNYRKMRIGAGFTGADLFNGKISNFRVTKGQALYTTAFKPSTEPLTTTSQGATASNVKLLCCNNSSTTGSTVTPVTPANNGSPTASTDSPFDDTEGFKFGADSDQGIVKCGSYIGNGSTTGPEIYLGWEPSWVLIKDTSASVNWRLHDSMRGITTGGDDPEMEPNTNDAESDSDRLSLTPTGFKLTTSSASHNDPGDVYLYVAIRRPDGYVGKPAEAGTDVFTMAVGNGSGIEPAFTSGFPIDFAFGRQPASVDNWYAWARFMQGKYLKTNGTAYQLNDGAAVFDWNTGFNLNYPSSYQSWMWKRGQGFDVVTYKGDGAARTINHSLNAVPQMMWIKDRTTTGGGGSPWYVYHSDTADSGMGYGYLNSDDAFSSSGLGGAWNSTAPTSTHFSLGTWAGVNYSGASFIAMLFSSVNGISKVGSYTGNDTSQSISLGFQPRFLILKNATSTEKWYVLDTVRGWVSGADEYMSLNTDYAQVSSNTFGEPTATGFDISGSDNWNNANGETFIYYAHA